MAATERLEMTHVRTHMKVGIGTIVFLLGGGVGVDDVSRNLSDPGR